MDPGAGPAALADIAPPLHAIVACAAEPLMAASIGAIPTQPSDSMVVTAVAAAMNRRMRDL